MTNFQTGPNFVVSVGIESDIPDAEGNLSKPVFLRREECASAILVRRPSISEIAPANVVVVGRC